MSLCRLGFERVKTLAADLKRLITRSDDGYVGPQLLHGFMIQVRATARQSAIPITIHNG